MAKVNGVGAVVLYADAPEALARWYSSRLGIETVYSEEGRCYYGTIEDATSDARVQFGILPSTERLEGGTRAVMINYRVDDLDEMLDALRAAGVEVARVLDDPLGRFAYIRDPEGNPIELWAER